MQLPIKRNIPLVPISYFSFMLRVISIFAFAAFLVACSSPTVSVSDADSSSSTQKTFESSSASNSRILTEALLGAISESGFYTTRDSVAAYLCKFEKLPSNYRTKAAAKELYNASGKTFSKWNFNPWETLGVMVGGDAFQNSEGLLPQNAYRECDVDYSAANRGTKRLVYAESCQIFYTANHYQSFTEIR